MITVLNKLSILFISDIDKVKNSRFHAPDLSCHQCRMNKLLREVKIHYENNS